MRGHKDLRVHMGTVCHIKNINGFEERRDDRALLARMKVRFNLIDQNRHASVDLLSFEFNDFSMFVNSPTSI